MLFIGHVAGVTSLTAVLLVGTVSTIVEAVTQRLVFDALTVVAREL